MKKIIIYILILSALLYSCSKKDDKSAFDKSPDERLNETLANYQSQLAGSQYGWKAVLYSDSGRGTAYGFYFKFNDSNRVKMLSDFDSTSASTLKESSYRLKALQQPSLIFDTYSYIHELADPNPDVNGGNEGSGLQTDFEFYFDTVTTDVIKLGGRFNGNKLVLTRATQQEAIAYNSGQLSAGFNINKLLTYFKRLTIGNQLIDIQINPLTRTIIFTWIDANGAVQTFTTTYYLTVNGIILTNPVIIGGLTIKSLDNISLDASTQIVGLTINNTPATITGIVVPLHVDLDAPANWYHFASTDPTYYSVSYNGFHVNGVDDAYGVKTIPNFYFLIFLPQFGTAGNINYDLLAYIFLDNNSLSIGYGSAFKAPLFTTDGRAIFPFLGTLGTVPGAYSSILLNTKTKMSNASGYYFVQTGFDEWDMVSAFDGKSWITWDPHQ